MNAIDFDKIVEARMSWCIRTLCAKGDEYAREGDRLWNFKVAGRKLNCHTAEALAGMMVKHTVSVDDIIDGLARGIVPPKELVAEKIGDSINYLLLLEGLIEEERQKREEVPEMNAAFKASTSEVYSGNITCPECSRSWPLGSEQGRWVNFTGRCAICQAEKKREAYKRQKREEVPDVVHIVPDKTSMATRPPGCLGRLCGRGDGDDWRPCPND